jgi:hypothetical protein
MKAMIASMRRNLPGRRTISTFQDVMVDGEGRVAFVNTAAGQVADTPSAWLY